MGGIHCHYTDTAKNPQNYHCCRGQASSQHPVSILLPIGHFYLCASLALLSIPLSQSSLSSTPILSLLSPLFPPISCHSHSSFRKNRSLSPHSFPFFSQHRHPVTADLHEMLYLPVLLYCAKYGYFKWHVKNIAHWKSFYKSELYMIIITLLLSAVLGTLLKKITTFFNYCFNCNLITLLITAFLEVTSLVVFSPLRLQILYAEAQTTYMGQPFIQGCARWTCRLPIFWSR